MPACFPTVLGHANTIQYNTVRIKQRGQGTAFVGFWSMSFFTGEVIHARRPTETGSATGVRLTAREERPAPRCEWYREVKQPPGKELAPPAALHTPGCLHPREWLPEVASPRAHVVRASSSDNVGLTPMSLLRCRRDGPTGGGPSGVATGGPVKAVARQPPRVVARLLCVRGSRVACRGRGLNSGGPPRDGIRWPTGADLVARVVDVEFERPTHSAVDRPVGAALRPMVPLPERELTPAGQPGGYHRRHRGGSTR